MTSASRDAFETTDWDQLGKGMEYYNQVGGASHGWKAYCRTCNKAAAWKAKDDEYGNREWKDGRRLTLEEMSREEATLRVNALKAAGLKMCSRCKQPGLYYCSRGCFKADWAEHKKVCGKGNSATTSGSGPKRGGGRASTYWYDRYVAEVGEEEAAAVDARLDVGAKKNKKAWFANLRETHDGGSHHGRLELITWRGNENGERKGFAAKAVGAPADREQARFERDYKPRGNAGMLEYFHECVRQSPVQGTGAFRWTCCGMDYSSARGGCDNHRLGCMCDYCIAGEPMGIGHGEGQFGVPEPDSQAAKGVPRPRKGETGHPASVTDMGKLNWKKRQEFFSRMGGAHKNIDAFLQSMISNASKR